MRVSEIFLKFLVGDFLAVILGSTIEQLWLEVSDSTSAYSFSLFSFQVCLLLWCTILIARCAMLPLTKDGGLLSCLAHLIEYARWLLSHAVFDPKVVAIAC